MLQISVQENNCAAGRLILQSSRATRAIKSRPNLVAISRRDSSKGETTAEFIKEAYRSAYGAHIEVRYPMLMGVNDHAGRILAAIGFRYACLGPLFLEQYTEHSIEETLQCTRSQVVEIGNLASLGGGASVYLFLALASYLQRKGIKYAVVTGTKSLEKRFRRIGLRPQIICSAEPEKLEAKGDNWGTYYDTQPTVMAGRVDLGLRSLQAAFGAEFHIEDATLAYNLEQAAGLAS